MPNIYQKILTLTQRLYPNGKAYRMPDGSYFEKLHSGLANSESKAWDGAISIYDCLIPDSYKFTDDDATSWERRLGIISNPNLSLTDREKAIRLKLNYPVTDAPRQYYKYIEEQLQAAGFNVFLYENSFDGIALTPEYILSTIGMNFHGEAYHANDTYHTGFQIIGSFHDDEFYHGDSAAYHGGGYNNLCVNYIDETLDSQFAIGDNYRSTFYIASQNFPDFANINAERKDEFRQLLLQLKPVQTVAILFVNYI